MQVLVHQTIAYPCTTPLLTCYRFVHSLRGSSRERLQTTREMLMLCFTYFQVMPEFVDFLFSFGYQSHAQDTHFSGFHQRTHLSERGQKLENVKLGSSNYSFKICYNLKSVERAGPNPRDWSMRHCAVHHSFDLIQVRVAWVVIKSNEVMKDRIEQTTSDGGSQGVSSFTSVDNAFAAALQTHLMVCEWSTEQWRWYINYLEDEFQKFSRRTLTAPVTLPSSPTTNAHNFSMPPRSDTQKTEVSILSKLSRRETYMSWKPSSHNEKPIPRVPRTYTNPDNGLSQPLPPHIAMSPTTEAPPDTNSNFENEDEDDFSFEKMQKIQHIEEKAHEALLTLGLNMKTISQLKEYYNTIVGSSRFTRHLGNKCDEDHEDFDLRMTGLENDLHRHILRLETLLRLLGNRKVLVNQVIQAAESSKLKQDQLHSILDFHNTESNKISTKNMTAITEEMSEIARKTKIETVSMKVITLVTLFFLPGTFISVRNPFCE